jgi:hypothetical protein
MKQPPPPSHAHTTSNQTKHPRPLRSRQRQRTRTLRSPRIATRNTCPTCDSGPYRRPVFASGIENRSRMVVALCGASNGRWTTTVRRYCATGRSFEIGDYRAGRTCALQGHCCVERSRGASHRCGLALRSDRVGEFIERGRETQTLVAGFHTQFVVAAPDVLNERMTADHRRRGPIGS